jgi:flagellar biosynthetic protein FlhB
MAAPVVLAKGAELLCEKIKQMAREHNVPVVERPELARALYASAEVGQMIPEPLYVAVAEVLAMIFRMRKQR